MSNNKKSFLNGYDIAFAILFAVSLLFVLWKCRYGYGNADEAFYLSTTYRVFNGDAMITEDWHLAQLFAFFSYPMMKIYFMFATSTEGIFLVFRRICVITQALVSLYTYLRLRKENKLGALICGLFVILYLPFGLMFLNYNNLGFFSMVICCVTLFTARKNIILQAAVSGFFYAIAVVNCPYLFALYILYVIYAIIAKIFKLRKGDPVFSFDGVFGVTAGGAILALAFGAFILSRSTVDDIVTALPWIMEDPTHWSNAWYTYFYDYFKSVVFDSSRRINATIVLYSAIGILLLAEIIDPGRKKHRGIYYTGAAGVVSLLVVNYCYTDRFPNLVIFPLNLLALFPIICGDADQKAKDAFVKIWIPGMVYSFINNMSSNQHYYVISSASAVASVGTILIMSYSIDNWLKEFNLKDRKAFLKFIYSVPVLSFIFVSCVYLCCIVFLRYYHIFWDTPIMNQNKLITVGPEKGLYVSEYFENWYLDRWNYYKAQDLKEGERVIISDDVVLYLIDGIRCGCFSVWPINDGNADMHKAYFDMNPHMLPERVYIQDGRAFPCEWFASEYGYSMTHEGSLTILTKQL